MRPTNRPRAFSDSFVHAIAVAVTLAACGGEMVGQTPARPAPTAANPPTVIERAAVKQAVPNPAPVAATTDDLARRRKQLADLLEQQWQYTLEHNPEIGTIVGDHRRDDQWTDLSQEAFAADLVKTKEFLDLFTAVDTTGFPEQEALNQQLMVRNLRDELDGAKFEPWLMPIDQQFGLQLQLPQMASQTSFTSVADYEHYITRLTKVPHVLDQLTALARAGMAKHLMPPKQQLTLTIAQAANLGKGDVTASAFAQPVAKFPAGISPADQKRLRAAVLAAVKDDVFPAYKKLATFLATEYVPAGRTEPGMWSLPDGEARYAFAVEQMTTTRMTPEQFHELGLSEVARIEGEEGQIATQLGFANLAALRAHVRTDKHLYATSAADILGRYHTAIDQMSQKLPSLFGRLPKAKIDVQPTEAFRAKDAADADYSAGSPDGARAGTVRVNTSNPTKRMWTDIEATAYHEGVPGHHLQLSIQQELPELPPFRQFGGYTAYVEGWALYAEKLGKDVGFYQDPYSDYGRLENEMLRAIRLVVDTGLHAKHWKRDQVVQYFHDHSTISEVTVQSETNRYIVTPAQALAYKAGEQTLLRLRAEARAAQGEAFDIRAFHDFVLGAGALPLDVLETRFHAWLHAATPPGTPTTRPALP